MYYIIFLRNSAKYDPSCPVTLCNKGNFFFHKIIYFFYLWINIYISSMKISIITVCFNSEETIVSTLNSVLSQTYDEIEHIIIDGGSIDRTLDILQQYEFKKKS